MRSGSLVVAIDGAAGSGKSTLARSLAMAIGLPYVNTGSMYRAVTLAAIERGVDPDDAQGIANLMPTFRFTLGGAPLQELWIDGEPASAALTGHEVEASVSKVARHPALRALMRQEQRRLGAGGAVMEGRDIASVVFPEAAVKIYLVADQTVRAGRRQAERDLAADPSALSARDAKDSTVNPFEPEPDATVIDTTDVDAVEVLELALAVVRDRTSGALG
jgi:cytidylate kinase